MLYEKYRPVRFSDVIGQNSNSLILKKQVECNCLAHSYLFSGNRGSGKTTTARILAKAINCENPINGEPCGQCQSCIEIQEGTSTDVIEIDAASNNGVDNVRSIIDNMNYAPKRKYKVYILDEAHMLSKSASNAFLKLLEEPPEFGVFILCTTEAEALPITVLSRCQQFKFNRIEIEDIKSRLKCICLNEGISIEDKGLNLISKLADGAMRDGISILEQIISSGASTYAEIANILSIAPNESAYKLLAFIKKCDSKNAIETLYSVLLKNDVVKFTETLIEILRNIMVLKSNASEDLIKMSDEDILIMKNLTNVFSFETLLNYLDVFSKTYQDFNKSQFKQMLLEMAIVKLTSNVQEHSNSNNANMNCNNNIVANNVSSNANSVNNTTGHVINNMTDNAKNSNTSTNNASNNNMINDSSTLINVFNQIRNYLAKLANTSKKAQLISIVDALNRTSPVWNEENPDSISLLTENITDSKLLSAVVINTKLLQDLFEQQFHKKIKINVY